MNKKTRKQLNILKEIHVDESFKKKNEEVLFSYISNTKTDLETSRFGFFVLWLKDFSKAISQPAFSILAFVLILVTGTVLIQPFRSAMPDDALYIARVISEKAQINITFNNESKSKLAAKIASDHAKDIATVLSDPKANNDQVAITKLNEDFKKEINIVKENLTKINRIKTNDNSEASSTDEETTFFAVGTEKNANGLEIYNNENSEESSNENILNKDPLEEIEIKDSLVEEVSTSTEASSTVEEAIIEEKIDSHEESLNNVQTLFDELKYEEALEGLNKIDEMFSQGEKKEERDDVEKEIESAS